MEDTQIFLSIKSFGGCSISAFKAGSPKAAIRITENDKRSVKLWALIEYLIFSGKADASSEELVSLMWPDKNVPDDPIAALRVLVHRARNELNRLELFSGSSLIKSKNKGYGFERLPGVIIDTEEFIKLCDLSKTGTLVQQLECLMQAASIYQGRFLPNSLSEHWVITLDSYYHMRYAEVCVRACEILNSFGRYRDIIILGKSAVTIDPYFEQMHTAIISAMGSLGLYREASDYYDRIAAMFMKEFAVTPSAEMVAAKKAVDERLPLQKAEVGIIRDTLIEDDPSGALQVSVNTFKQICKLKLREIARTGQAIQLVLITLNEDPNAKLDLKTLLAITIADRLRADDLFTSVNENQYLLLLQSTTYENAGGVLKRIHESFLSMAGRPSPEFQYSILPFAPHTLQAVMTKWSNTDQI